MELSREQERHVKVIFDQRWTRDGDEIPLSQDRILYDEYLRAYHLFLSGWKQGWYDCDKQSHPTA